MYKLIALINRRAVVRLASDSFIRFVITTHFAKNPIVGGMPASLVKMIIVDHSLFLENVSLLILFCFILLTMVRIAVSEAQ